MKNKTIAKKAPIQGISNVKNKYEFIYRSRDLAMFFTVVILIGIPVMLEIIHALINFDGNFRIIILPIWLILAFIDVPRTKRKGYCILYDNYIELFLHKTKHIIQYHEITQLIWSLQAWEGSYYLIKTVGKRTISIGEYLAPLRFGKETKQSEKDIQIFRKALERKIKEKRPNDWRKIIKSV